MLPEDFLVSPLVWWSLSIVLLNVYPPPFCELFIIGPFFDLSFPFTLMQCPKMS